MKYSIIVLALLLAGCAKEPAGYRIPGPADLSVTVERVKSYFWKSGWELNLIVRNDPVCQRRHVMKPTSGDKFRVELYSPEPAVLILRQGKRWYVTELRQCNFQAYQEPPPEPGELLGAFQEKDGTFKFVESKDKTARGNASAETE
jgi:hypothetical protein